jgi:hypothetical protein
VRTVKSTTLAEKAAQITFDKATRERAPVLVGGSVNQEVAQYALAVVNALADQQAEKGAQYALTPAEIAHAQTAAVQQLRQLAYGGGNGD